MNKEKLYDLYWNKEMSIRKIAKELKISGGTIFRKMKEFNIPRRTKSEVNSGKFRKGKKLIPHRENCNCFRCKPKKGKEHHNWKENASYSALHYWVKRHKPKPEVCEICHKKFDKYQNDKLELSNISGKYKRNINDWQWVHHSCHVNYDRQEGLWSYSHKNYIKSETK